MISVMCSLLGKPRDNKTGICGISVMICSCGRVSLKLGLSPGHPSQKEFTECLVQACCAQCFLAGVPVVLSWKSEYQSLVAAVK